MPDPVQTLSLLVESAVAIAGFSGVVVALGRRAAGHWSPLDRVRLNNLLVSSLGVLFLSLVGLVLLHAGLAAGETWRILSGLWCLVVVYQAFWIQRRLRAVSPDAPHRAGTLTSTLIYAGNVTLVVVNVINIVWYMDFWPFLTAQVWLFGLACHAFVRLLLFLGPGDEVG